jgi:GTP-binding protein EngB required for normal cell division/methyl-accepting chemotaxis protein
MTTNQDDIKTAPQALLGELAQCLAALRGQPGVPEAAWREVHEKIAAQTFNLVVAGQFKRGKSSLINALLGAELLPVGVVPLTSVVTILSAGETTQVEVEFEDGRTESVPPERLAEYVTEKGNPKNVMKVRIVHIRHPSPWLRGGVRLVDTPGIGSVYRHNTDVARGFLPKADAVLFVLSVDQPLSQAEHDFLKEIIGYAARVFVLLNKTDLLSPGELRESLQFTAGALAELMGGPVRLFPVSAREALRNDPNGAEERYERSGFPAFTHALSAFLMQEKGAALAAVAARNLARLAEQARFGVELERRSLATPLEELRRKLRLFEDRKQESLGARQDYITLIEGEGRRLVREIVEPDLETFQRTLGERMRASLARHLQEHHGLPTRQLYDTLERLVSGEVKQAYDEFRAAEDEKVARAFDALCARFTGRINATVDELQRFAADLFEIPFSPVSAESLMKFESGFYYKFWTEPPGLEIIMSSAALSLPGILGARLVRRRIERRAAELIEIHAGRLRYDLAQRIERGAREFRTLVGEQIDATVAGIEAAVRKGMDVGQSTQREIEARAASLLAARRMLEEVRSRIEGVRSAVAEAFSFGAGAASAAPPEKLEGGAA